MGDSLEKIEEAIKFAKQTSDLVILSGGLGATDDDLIKEVIRKFLDKKLVI